MKQARSPLRRLSLAGLLLLTAVCLSPCASAQIDPAVRPVETPRPPSPVAEGTIEVAVFLLPGGQGAWPSGPDPQQPSPSYGLAIQFVPSAPGAGWASIISPDTGLPGVPLGPYVMGPDGSAVSPNPQVNQLLGAIETTYRSYPNGPGPVAGTGDALAEPKRAEIPVGLKTLRLQVDWPENAPRYYLEKAGEDAYRKVELAYRPGFTVTLTRAGQAGAPEIGLELVRRVVEGGEYDADIGARVGRPLVLQASCTASAPVLPGLTTVATWRLADGVRAIQVLDTLPETIVDFVQAYRLHATAPCLQIRMRMVGASSER